jgi:flagellar motor protein MotB
MYLAVVGAASAAQRPAANELQLEPAVGSLTGSWGVSSTTGLKGFRVRWRPLTTPSSGWGKPVDLPAKARSYAITGLQPATYEVRVRSIVGATSRAGSGHKKTVLVLGGFTTGAATALAIGAELPGELPGPPKEEKRHEEAPKEKAPPTEKGKEQPKEAPKEQPKEAPKEQPKEEPKEQPKEEPKEQPKEEPKEQPKEEQPKEKLPKEKKHQKEKEQPHEEPPAEEPPVEEPPAEEPPVEEPPVEEESGGPSCSLYGAPSGSDANGGTQSAPLKTVHALLGKLKAGQTGCLAQGSYEGFTTRGGESHGSAGAPVTITSTDPQAPATISGRVVTIPGADYLTFSHLNFTDSQTTTPSVTIGSAHTTWIYDDVTAPHTICFETIGAGQFGPASDTLIEHTRVHNCGQPFKCDSGEKPCNEPPNDGYFIHGLYDLGTRTTVRNSYFYEISSKGILLRGSSGSVIEHNVIDGDGSGVSFGDLGPVNDTVRWNLITNSSGICGSCKEYYGLWSFGSVGSGNSATNNVLFGNTSGNLGPHSGVTVAENIEVDPKYADAAKHDYTLPLDSPALGYGPE